MANWINKAVLGTALGASVLVAVAPAAEAQRYRRYRHHDDTGTAIVAGIAGLAIGAALASGNDRRYDYDRRYYRERGYYPTDGYYYRDYQRRYRGWDRCHTRRVWDPYLDRPVRVRYCR
ncbi:hypothetical protein FHS95_001397 [Sphingomonas naasensis]|uniref:Uncharacterized protein n=1 Tax=Sphingomonas naasensis TaxID=1344951 RepID=A0A4S1WB75_9SPHN|nr:hypothetical protein [Sphingomonas naasensis]NIJ19728.1 hypothetical protein [Sphingomonas naasensis]TGX40128.1 hypothetical protein E5A74_16305 [Sphingomonas naasensis]